MPIFEGNIRKMRVSADETGLVNYQLPVGEHLVSVNDLVGSLVKVTYSGEINCINCSTKTKKSFNQGYCYRCLMKLAQCDSCIIRPETCHYDQGTCREPSWGEENCLKDHFVYLANTGTTKIGITRFVTDGVSSRWMDQGATQAIPILRVKNRLVSGLVETAFKSHIADKTNWRTMLKGPAQSVDLVALREQLFANVEADLENIYSQHGIQAINFVDSEVVNIRYPVEAYPDKIKSINLDKELSFEGVLQGVKGQYWMLDNDRVINMRKYSGYNLSLETFEG